MTRGEDTVYDAGGCPLPLLEGISHPSHILQNAHKMDSPQVLPQYSIKNERSWGIDLVPSRLLCCHHFYVTIQKSGVYIHVWRSAFLDRKSHPLSPCSGRLIPQPRRSPFLKQPQQNARFRILGCYSDCSSEPNRSSYLLSFSGRCIVA